MIKLSMLLTYFGIQRRLCLVKWNFNPMPYTYYNLRRKNKKFYVNLNSKRQLFCKIYLNINMVNSRILKALSVKLILFNLQKMFLQKLKKIKAITTVLWVIILTNLMSYIFYIIQWKYLVNKLKLQVNWVILNKLKLVNT